MAQIETRLGTMEEAIRGLTAALEKSEEYRREDHDYLLEIGQKVDTLCKDVDEIKDDKKQKAKADSSRVWHGFFILIGAAIGAVSAWVTSMFKGGQ
jgi:hypothetical protein